MHSFSDSLFCRICPLSKQRRQAFTSQNYVESEPFALLYCAYGGAYHTATYLGQRYLLTLMDDHCRFAWTYLFNQKSEAANVIKKFFCLVETQFNKSTKVFRSDNARELLMTKFFASKRVLHQFSCVERP